MGQQHKRLEPQVIYTAPWGVLQIDIASIGGVPYLAFSDMQTGEVLVATPK